MDRRPIKSRNASWAQNCAALLARAGITPNTISIMSLIFSLIGGCLLFYVSQGGSPYWLPVVALCVGMRLTCNLLDGMVAVEHKQGSPLGDLYNDIPDRIADLLLIVPLGFLTGGDSLWISLGWCAAALSLLTAYLRFLSGALIQYQDFQGPLDKKGRMLTIITACLCALFFPHLIVFKLTIVVLIIGTAGTFLKRLRTLTSSLLSV